LARAPHKGTARCARVAIRNGAGRRASAIDHRLPHSARLSSRTLRVPYDLALHEGRHDGGFAGFRHESDGVTACARELPFAQVVGAGQDDSKLGVTGAELARELETASARE